MSDRLLLRRRSTGTGSVPKEQQEVCLRGEESEVWPKTPDLLWPSEVDTPLSERSRETETRCWKRSQWLEMFWSFDLWGLQSSLCAETR